MQIILTENVEKLGEIGDIVDVADGYGRNYLLPRNMAVRATEGNVAQIENIKKQKAAQEKKHKESMEKKAQELDGLSCDISVEVDDEDRIYGTVNERMVAAALEEQEGVHVDKDKLEIEEPIKNLGIYLVPVKLHPDITPTIKVWVVKE